MKSFDELTNTDDPAIDLIREWIDDADNNCEILPPSVDREAVLFEVQVTTHSTMGAVAYEKLYLGQGSASAGQLTQQDAEHILLIREEEKLARDVYLTLGEKWNVPVFRNIAQAEARHMSLMKMLVDRYGLQDPVTDDTVGAFTSSEFTKLYGELVASGSESLAAAYGVGIKIEQMDIKDLKDSLATVQSTDVRRVYQNLLRASENHLRAFSANR